MNWLLRVTGCSYLEVIESTPSGLGCSNGLLDGSWSRDAPSRRGCRFNKKDFGRKLMHLGPAKAYTPFTKPKSKGLGLRLKDLTSRRVRQITLSHRLARPRLLRLPPSSVPASTSIPSSSATPSSFSPSSTVSASRQPLGEPSSFLSSSSVEPSSTELCHEEPSTTEAWPTDTSIHQTETSTILSTRTYTITSCKPTVTDCPVGKTTTEVFTSYTTYYPGETAQLGHNTGAPKTKEAGSDNRAATKAEI